MVILILLGITWFLSAIHEELGALFIVFCCFYFALKLLGV